VLTIAGPSACGRSAIAGDPDAGDDGTDDGTTGDPGGPIREDLPPDGGDDTGDDDGGFIPDTHDDTSEPPPTCREIITCAKDCLLGGSLDVACFEPCAVGAESEELTLAGDLLTCIVTSCFESGSCTTETLTEAGCLACIGFKLNDLTPQGCIEEGVACD
jgi:hypothetical protein